MVEDGRLVVGFDRAMSALVLAGALMFVALGAYLLLADSETLEDSRRYGVVFLRGLGVVTVLFFGFCALAAARMLLQRGPALVLAPDGLRDATRVLRAGLIPWSDIRGFRTWSYHGERMVVVRLRDPERYLRARGPLARAIGRLNMRLCGSPVTISSRALRIGHNALLDACREWHARHHPPVRRAVVQP